MTKFETDFFVCHSSADGKEAAREIVADLEERGVSCWIAPRNIPVGMTWPRAIVSGVEGSRAMLLLVTKGANDSAEIEKEVTLASTLRKVIFPIRVADVSLSGALRYQVQTRQWRDIFVDREAVISEIVAQITIMRDDFPDSNSSTIEDESPQWSRASSASGVEASKISRDSVATPAAHSLDRGWVTPVTTLPRFDVIAASPHSLAAASAPVLLLVASLYSQLSRAGEAPLEELFAHSIEKFERDGRADGASPNQVVIAKYALSSTIDDAVHNLSLRGISLPMNGNMRARFFGEPDVSTRFFSDLGDAIENPSVNLGLLEIVHTCLCLGFDISAMSDSSPHIIRRDLFEAIQRSRAAADLKSWKPTEVAFSRFRVPTWPIALLAFLVLISAYFLMRNSLANEMDGLALSAGRLSGEQ